MNTFITAVETKEITVTGKGFEDPQIESHNINIYWRLDLETRKWGIKEISVYATEASGSFEVYDDYTEDKKPEQFYTHNFQVESEGPESLDISIYIEEIRIDLDDKIITVLF